MGEGQEDCEEGDWVGEEGEDGDAEGGESRVGRLRLLC